MYMSTVEVPITTIEELLALPDDGLRHELLDGEHVVTPAPRLTHQEVVEDLAWLLNGFVRAQSGFRLFSVAADIHLGARSLVQPDISVFKLAGRKPTSWTDLPVPLLVVEVLSPGTAGRDRGKKREIYQKAGVAEYWIVDIDSRLVERWLPGDKRPEIVRRKLTWWADGDGPELTLDVNSLLAGLPRPDDD
jgi:Uma2 family endonuclease